MKQNRLSFHFKFEEMSGFKIQQLTYFYVLQKEVNVFKGTLMQI